MKKMSLFFIWLYYWTIQISAASADSNFSSGLKATAEGNGAGYEKFDSAGLTMAKLTGKVLAPAFVGVMGTLLLFYGGYTWMMSRGNEQEVARAKTIITNTLIAMFFVLLAWAVVTLIVPLWGKVTL